MPSFLITAGPTREFIDPVRYLSNASSGMMGYALAEAARKKKHRVTLVSGPVALPPPKGVRVVSVTSARQMLAVVRRLLPCADVFIGAAAVADYRARRISRRKIKKGATSLTFSLVRTPDILRYAARRRRGKVLVGFALESHGLLRAARAKLKGKKLDLIVGNTPEAIGRTASSVWLIGPEGVRAVLKNRKKTELAERIIDEAVGIWQNRAAGPAAA